MNEHQVTPARETEVESLRAMLVRLEEPLTEYLHRVNRDRRGAGIWALFKRAGLVLMFLLGLILWLYINGNVLGISPSVIKPTVAQIDINGPIGPGNLASADRLVPLIENLCAQENVRAIVLHINSPGGAPGDAERVGAAVDNCRTMPAAKDGKASKLANRRVLAVVDGLCASAGYMIAIHADEIVANPTGFAGSIGVIIEGFKVDGLMEKTGVSSYVYATGPMKSMLSPYVQDSPRQKEVAQELADGAMEVFKGEVVKRRKNLRLDTPDLWSGRVWVASEAKDIGLIDTIDLLEPTERRQFPDLEVQRFEPQRNVRDALTMETWVHAIGAEFTARTMQLR